MTSPHPVPEIPAEIREIEAPDDFEWARDRVISMCAAALLDSRVYGRRLLKGFGWPNEMFGRAQDARALATLLHALDTARAHGQQEAREQMDARLVECGVCHPHDAVSAICRLGTKCCPDNHDALEALTAAQGIQKD